MFCAAALDAAVGIKVDMAALGSGSATRPVVHVDSSGGTRTTHFAGEETPTKRVRESNCAPDSVRFKACLETKLSLPVILGPLRQLCHAEIRELCHIALTEATRLHVRQLLMHGFINVCSGINMLFAASQDAEKRSDLADSWQIDSSTLQCRMRDGQPVRLGKGELLCRLSVHLPLT